MLESLLDASEVACTVVDDSYGFHEGDSSRAVLAGPVPDGVADGAVTR